ncbi:MAG: Rossmann-like domain-containing protein [Candidatus Thorarchaeota archaeon]
MILEKTVELVKQIYKDHEIIPPKISKVVIGLGYTGVEISLDDVEPILGLASTLPSVINNVDCSKIKFAGNLTNKKLLELAEWSYLEPSLEKIIGIAALNAVSQHILRLENHYSKLKGDPLNFLEINQDTNITIIGLMKPFIRKLIKKTRDITLVEDTLRVPKEFQEFKFLTAINEFKKDEISTDILFCTGTSLINNTFEQILKLFRKKTKKIIVMGPSVGILPDILFNHGVDIVGGMEITNSEEVLKILQEGGGTQIFKKYGKKYNLIKK